MDMHDYGFELLIRQRVAEMRTEAEHRRRLQTQGAMAPRPQLSLRAVLTWIERVLGVGRLPTSRATPRASNHQRAA